MRKLILVSAVFFSMLLIAPAWSHHPAEGIVSDDIWQMVDDLLTEADSPHLDIDFDDVMASMGVVTDPEGNLSLVTSILVETQFVDEYMEYIDIVLDAANRVPSGKTNSDTASILVVVTTDGDGTNDIELGMTLISIYEPVGVGNSQDGIDPSNWDN